VVEIGPGPGGLTRSLLLSGCAGVVAVERDARCVAALGGLVAVAAGRLTLVHQDALAVDPEALAPAPRAVVANLPYNVATPLLIGWLRRIEAFRSLTLMFQKEVADRLAASPRTPAYGRLSVIAQWRAVVAPVLTLPPRAFTPPPKVSSTVVHLTPAPDPAAVPFAAMERVTAAAFGQRRKMLRASLKTLGAETAERLLAETGLPPTARAEEIDIAGFVALSRAWASTAEPPMA
jgi:16S rRNA (adenine1518-N6/adenine1519-N6)-dimethyltransferase